MKCTLLSTLLATLAATSLAAPFQLSDIFPGFVAIAQPQEKQEVVKRHVVANPDAELKQISFHGLIGDLEDSLFQSALSLHSASAPDSEVEEVKPGTEEVSEDSEHALTKRSDESTPATDTTSTDDGLARKILLQTTKKVPGSEDGLPAHLIIDHVSVQPHNGGILPLIPTFQVHHTKLISATIKEDSNNDSSDGKQTKISITKTSITSTAPLESLEEAVASSSSISSSSSSAAPTPTTTEGPAAKEATTTVETLKTAEEESNSSSSSPNANANTTTTIPESSSTSAATTEEPIQKLKKDEEKLKEKVAEVEADPVILSSRV
ncbi:cell wall protein DAN4 [Drosophila pseudoobscura]|uniref:Cell wall protein DAN4 n=1 Tax=Drosophila pseudoobscura pseudoobscura TaxID=46245 RepID=A0A6I8V0A1_DROPS|nr:cell wall protein DAN4 [Drosophila pseudoobscura]